MLLLRCNIHCCNIHKEGAQYSWDTHIVDKSKGDVRGLAPEGHTEAHRTKNGEPPPIDIMEHGCQLTQRLELGFDRKDRPACKRRATPCIQDGPCSKVDTFRQE